MSQLLTVQLSDIHFREGSNPVDDRLEALLAAVLSIRPRPDACLVLLTGDIAFSGKKTEYKRAFIFLSGLRVQLAEFFGNQNVFFEVIAGNHDCLQAEDELGVRAALVAGAPERILTKTPDRGYLNILLNPQSHFHEFVEKFTVTPVLGDERVCRSRTIRVASKLVELIGINTALLSQRDEQVGTLGVPMSLLNDLPVKESDVDVTLCVYHHPDNWLEPNLRREFRKFVESNAHIVFTGHEHLQDNHWTEASTGENTAYLEADALQAKDYPIRSGFNCLVIDFDASSVLYYHYRWKNNRYSALVDGVSHAIVFSKKSQDRFNLTERFHNQLVQDDFGFTHKLHSDLVLADFFVYPPVSVSAPGSSDTKQVAGRDLLKYLLTQRCVYLRGQERAGKTSLLKTLYLDILKSSSRIPVLLSGEALDGNFSHLLRLSVRNQYGSDAVEPFGQLDSSRKVILIDDFNKRRTGSVPKQALLQILKAEADLVVIVSSDLPDVADYGATTVETHEPIFSALVTIRELPPSSRAEIVQKWLRMGRQDSEDSPEFRRDAEREQNVLSDLIRRKALPALPYLVVGVLQIRQDDAGDTVDPGSFGFLFQRLVTDALNTTSTNTKPYIDRKDGILRRFAYALFITDTESGSRADFDEAARLYSEQIGIRVNIDTMLKELLQARILKEIDGNLLFRHPYFYHFFLAKHLRDLIDADPSSEARNQLNDMADRPLMRDNQLTLIFYLFFHSRDPIIDRLVSLANQTFPHEAVSDLTSDVRFIDEGLHVLEQAHIDEEVSVTQEAPVRLQTQDRTEAESNSRPEKPLEAVYCDELSVEVKIRFAHARMELLGQIIRGFSGTLDLTKKVEILESVFKLGLRTLHCVLNVLSVFATSSNEQFEKIEDKDLRDKIRVLVNDLVALFARFYCDGALIGISQAVGVSDIEQAYENAAAKVGDTCATQLLGLAIKLDHSEAFPMQFFQTANRRVSKESRLASAVLSDLVQRHTQIIPLHRDTLRKIAGELRVNPTQLLRNAGHVPRRPQS
ncbi:hypothetical protein HDF16_005355 [Granulicella aggregans]|uniref:Calcineurin-like phosphoesterase domain-containing protein n=1 Tax=Granulicella aggregans TaxID=474949 RepID=A0A7W8E6R6_9BACT|nr:metallophosphoesterase [Granulicella aggregans]MBB5060619.1 hypothetical protein [Granulicella aggregans]